MADKRAARRNLRRLERVKTWQLLILFVLVCFVAATFLRINNVGMIPVSYTHLTLPTNREV